MADPNPTHGLLDEENNLVALVFPDGEDGALVELPAAFWDHPHRWDKPTSSFVVDLPAMRAAAWESVKRTRVDKLLLSPTGYGTAQTDVDSMVKINALVRLAAARTGVGGFSVTFTMADNSERELSAAQMIAFADDIDEYIAAVHARGRELRSEIEAASSAEDLSGIDLEAGWPE